MNDGNSDARAFRLQPFARQYTGLGQLKKSVNDAGDARQTDRIPWSGIVDRSLGASRHSRSLAEVQLEEREHLGVEVGMKGDTVEAMAIAADF